MKITLRSLCAVLMIGTPASAQEYRFEVNDLLRLRVANWDSLTGEAVDWTVLTGEYRVGADGTIVLPFAGRVEARGHVASELEEQIIANLTERLALPEPPDVVVDVAAWAPVIVTGDVRTPGPYEYTPGMLAFQAAALAGGSGARLDDSGSTRRDLAAQLTSLSILRLEERRLIASRLRLQAELEGSEAPLVAPDSDPAWAALLEAEEQIRRIRRDQLARELSSIESQYELYTAEIESLERRNEVLTKQRDLATEQASDTGSLAERGLVGSQRVFDTERLAADIEGQLLDVSTEILRARQNRAAAERESSSLRDQRTSENLVTLRDVNARLSDTRQRISGQLVLIEELGGSAAALPDVEPTLTVLRVVDGELIRVEEADLTPLRPGDIVEVELPLPLDVAPVASLGIDPTSVEDTSLAAPSQLALPSELSTKNDRASVAAPVEPPPAITEPLPAEEILPEEIEPLQAEIPPPEAAEPEPAEPLTDAQQPIPRPAVSPPARPSRSLSSVANAG